MDFTNMSTEVADKIKNASSYEELAELAKESGLELSDDQLEGVSGGGPWDNGCDIYEAVPCDNNKCCTGSVPVRTTDASFDLGRKEALPNPTITKVPAPVGLM